MKKTFLGLVVTLSLALAGCSRAPVPRELAAPPETVRKLEQPPFLTDIHGVVFSHDSKWIAAHVGDGISIWSVETGQLVSSFKGADPRNGETMTFSKDGKQLLQGSNVIRTRDVATGKPIKELNIAPREMSRPIFNRDATMAAIIPNNPRDLEIIDVADGKVLLEIPEYWGHLSGHVDFSPDGKTLVASTWSGLVQIWNIGSGGVIRTLRQRDRTSRDLDRAESRFSPDGEYVICREHRKDRDPNFNERFVVWKVSDGTAVASIDKANAAVLTPDNRHALLWRKYDEIPGAPRSHTVSLHDLRTGTSMRWISRDVEGEGRAMSPDGKWLAVVKEHVLERTGHADRFTIQLLAVPERVEPRPESKGSEAMPSSR